MASFYEVLGVPESASQEVLKAAFRKAAMRWHPDRNLGNEKYAAERFKEAKFAFEFLSDPERRARYDGERAEAKAKASEGAADKTQDEAFLKLLRTLTDAAVTLARQGRDRAFIIKLLVEEGCALNIAQFVTEQAIQIVAGQTAQQSKRTAESSSSRPFAEPPSGDETSTSADQKTSRKIAGVVALGLVVLIGGILLNLQPQAPRARGAMVSSNAESPVRVADGLSASNAASRDAQNEESIEDPFDGPGAATPMLSADGGAIPPSQLAVERWGIEQDEFGEKLLADVSKRKKTLWLKGATTVSARQFEGDVVFQAWLGRVPNVKNVAVKYIGAREFGGNEDGPLWWALLFSTTPVGVPFRCAECKPLISAIAMTVDNEGKIEIKTDFVGLGEFGRYGTYPLKRQAIGKTPISADETLLSLHDPRTVGGIDSAHVRYFRVEESRMREVLEMPYWTDNSRSIRCAGKHNLGTCGVYAPKLSWIKERGRPYWSLQVDEEGTKTDESGKFAPNRGRYYFRFDGNVFRRDDAGS
ncbi:MULTISPECIES: DnaJ domain-containing protein [unclassified Caballeronia]|uniref:J domain-containing protein n=1 Tax=unclassified Caballeronia TaxID=2646786 RepID=UPI0028667534|nr:MULTISPECIES: DnaJ domain-containing protein [unclassified Caballeronia]MDR5750205.1 DnaJ domain-containing protein [Caballeronia sp. LZ024]MDR5842666.1 DnaJ domain-containing protein [Caballeronia sp. LZ031]